MMTSKLNKFELGLIQGDPIYRCDLSHGANNGMTNGITRDDHMGPPP